MNPKNHPNNHPNGTNHRLYGVFLLPCGSRQKPKQETGPPHGPHPGTAATVQATESVAAGLSSSRSSSSSGSSVAPVLSFRNRGPGALAAEGHPAGSWDDGQGRARKTRERGGDQENGLENGNGLS